MENIKIYLTKNMFNKLIEKGELKYTFTDKRKGILYSARRIISFNF